MKNQKYNIGDCKLFKTSNSTEIGEIIKVYKTKFGYLYDMKYVKNKLEVICSVYENNIIKINKCKPILTEWCKKNIEKINKAFGKDMSEFSLIDYESLDDYRKEWSDVFTEMEVDKYLKKVDTKFVMQIS